VILTYGIGPELAQIASGQAKLGWKVPLIGNWTLAMTSFIDNAEPNGDGAMMPQTFIQLPSMISAKRSPRASPLTFRPTRALSPPISVAQKRRSRRMLQVTGLHAGYGKVQVLHGIALGVPAGQLVALIGSDGAGKTTTLRALSGMIAPTVGQITLAGQPIAGLPSHAITRRGMAHSPEARRVFATLSVADNLVMGAFPRLTGARTRGNVAADLDRMYELFPRLAKRRVQMAGTLSGGEQQMLAMARALMLRPEVLLLDEPSMGLSPKLVEEVFATIVRLKAEHITMLLVVQFAQAALEIADHGYVLENGRITVEGPAAQLRNDPAVKAAYMGAAH
jgi:branched-chain amino acid transport system ATP-binding protein